jgi:hypothetical protein
MNAEIGGVPRPYSFTGLSRIGLYQPGMRIDPVDIPAEELVLPRRLGVLGTYAIFVCWTLFSVFIYSRFSQLGDAKSYLTGAYDETGDARTRVITLIATRLIGLVHVDLLAHLTYSLFAASGVAYLVSQARVHGRYRWPLLAILLLPNFGVWASVIGRESLFIGLLGFFMGSVVGYFVDRGLQRVLLALVCVAGMTFIRAPFGMAAGLFLVMFLLYTWGPRVPLSAGVQALAFAAISTLVLIWIWPKIDDYIAYDVLPKAKTFFTIYSDTTRLWINLDTTSQYFRSLWWTLPLALVGPTPHEVMARPVMLPFFVSGVTVMLVLLFSIRVAVLKSRGVVRKILVLGWLPAMAVMLLSYVPFGIYNPGSGIRYASCFLLFLVLPSMFLSAVTAEEHERLRVVLPRQRRRYPALANYR